MTHASSRRAPTRIAATRASMASSIRKRVSRISPASCSAVFVPMAFWMCLTCPLPDEVQEAYRQEQRFGSGFLPV